MKEDGNISQNNERFVFPIETQSLCVYAYQAFLPSVLGIPVAVSVLFPFGDHLSHLQFAQVYLKLRKLNAMKSLCL